MDPGIVANPDDYGLGPDSNDDGIYVYPNDPRLVPEDGDSEGYTLLPGTIGPEGSGRDGYTLLPETARPDYVDSEKIDKWWLREMGRPGLGREVPAELLIQTVERTGHVPTPVTDGLRPAILVGDPAEKVEAGKQIAKLKKTAPDVAEILINRLPPEEAQQITIIAGIAELPLTRQGTGRDPDLGAAKQT